MTRRYNKSESIRYRTGQILECLLRREGIKKKESKPCELYKIFM